MSYPITGAPPSTSLKPGDIDTLAELNANFTDGTVLIDTTDPRLSGSGNVDVDAKNPTIAAGALVIDLESTPITYHVVSLDDDLGSGSISATNVPTSDVIEVHLEFLQATPEGTLYDVDGAALSSWTGTVTIDSPWSIYQDETPSIIRLLSTDSGATFRVTTNAPITPASIGAATEAQGDLADTAVQPGGLATVATSGSYNDLSSKPTLGTSAAVDVGTSANNVVQLDGSARLPAVDGSQLTGISGSGGGGIALPYVAGRYYVLSSSTWGVLSTRALEANRVYAVPIFVGTTMTVADVAINVTTAGSGSSLGYVGIYTDSDGEPDALVSGFATSSLGLSSTGAKQFTPASPVSLSAGVYWAAVLANEAVTISGVPAASSQNIGQPSVGTTAATVLSQGSLTFEAMPATFFSSATTLNNTVAPAFYFQE